MNTYGIIGYPLTHSFSPDYFAQKFVREKLQQAVYKKFEIESIELLPKVIQKQPGLKGLNVTIPYKESIIPFLHALDETAQQVGAVNTIKVSVQKNGKKKLEGYNTDVYGFEKSLSKHISKKPAHALVLGTGGASKAVVYVLKKMKIPFELISREKKPNCLSYADLNEAYVEQNKLIINTTPVGMYPHVKDFPPIPYGGIKKGHLLFDLIYNPGESMFLKLGKQEGAQAVNGLEMLVYQAEKSWKIWNM
jgi:shikimate dehydrogenase